MNPNDYNFELPLLITEQELEPLEPKYWKAGETWVEALTSRPDLKGIVLPLELMAKGTKRQQLWGVDLMNWLRWSGAEGVRYVPVFATAWQSLATVLRKKRNLLLIAEGTRFLRLPDAAENRSKAVSGFVEAVRAGEVEACEEKILTKYAGAGSEEVARVTYHDLANDFYAAYRLWHGYQYSLKVAEGKARRKIEEWEKVKAEIKRARDHTENLECEKEVCKKKCEPWFHQYQALARTRELPSYPDPGFPQARFVRHICDGLPPKVRILFVDDEFDKGMAEVLLQILLRKNAFTYKKELDKPRSEWVYVEESHDSPRVRLVCVKDVVAARNWLYMWGELTFPTNKPETKIAFEEWVKAWGVATGSRVNFLVDPKRFSPGKLLEEAKEFLSDCGLHELRQEAGKYEEGRERWEGLEPDEDKKIVPPKMKTIVLLDLRLVRERAERHYEATKLPSIQLRRQIIKEDRNLAVIIFTASRNAMNYVEVLNDAGPIDGWIWKEAPDVPENDDYSKRVVESLLARIYRYGAAPPGYRTSLNWDAEIRGKPWFKEYLCDYRKLQASSEREIHLSSVFGKATDIFESIKQNAFARNFQTEKEKRGDLKFLGFIQKLVTDERIIQWLVARRVAVAAYFWTGSPKGDNWQRDVQRLSAAIGAKPPAGKDKDNPSKVIAFQRDLALSYVEGEILGQLLPEEIDWLLEQKWGNKQKQAILERAKEKILHQCRAEDSGL